MTIYRIVCKVLSMDGHRIEQVGLTDSMFNHIVNSTATPETINEMIENGERVFVVNESGDEVEVIQFCDDFIKTKPEGIIQNNLFHLKDCNFNSYFDKILSQQIYDFFNKKNL